MKPAGLLPLGLFLASAACGGVSTEPLLTDAGGGGDAARRDGAPAEARGDDVAQDGLPPADGPIPCGTTTCDPSAYCVSPCCGGYLPPCTPEDGGACPPGTHVDTSCNEVSGMPGAMCRPDPCTPPPPYCSPVPSCGSGFGGGPPPEGHQVICACG